MQNEENCAVFQFKKNEKILEFKIPCYTRNNGK